MHGDTLPDLKSLQATHGYGVQIKFTTSDVGPAVELNKRGARAVIALAGAQLLSWQPEGQDDAIWLSPDAKPAPGKSLRGGAPVCWPWFGADPEKRGRPAHGFVRGTPWQVLRTKPTPSDVSITFAFQVTEEHHDLWPHPARAELTFKLSRDQLSLDLETLNTGTAPFVLGQALHTYFAVGSIAATEVTGLDGCTYIDTLQNWTRHTQQGPVRFDGEVDRIYLDTPDCIEIVDSANARRIAITARGSRSAVVWNPWIAKSERLGDMGPDGYRRMVCVETANAADDVVTLGPGEAHTLGATYRIRTS
ncbi:MAG: D-hexose-6-phosphate mutarotase [Hyphomicrobiaceae bacterium]